MVYKRRYNCFLILAMVLQVCTADAQMFKRRRALQEQGPKFLLVQLPTERRKIEWFAKNPNKSLVTELQNDAKNIRERIVLDFKDNFKYCPVYFFVDSNADLVKHKQFNGVLLGNDLRPVTNATGVTERYQVVMFTFGGATTEDFNETGGGAKDAHYNLGGSRQRLVLYDENFIRIKSPAPNGAETSGMEARRYGNRNPQYAYKSKHFDLYYQPYANQVQEELAAFYR